MKVCRAERLCKELIAREIICDYRPRAGIRLSQQSASRRWRMGPVSQTTILNEWRP
jgi:hypothetical protein